MILAEAMAIGCPVVSTNIGNAGDILVNSKGGTTFEPDKPDTFINAIEDVLQKTKYIRKMHWPITAKHCQKIKIMFSKTIYMNICSGGG